jgi:tRNA(fMet)-specific endonuclease VapC
MHLLDTDTLIHLHTGHPRVVDRLRTTSDPSIATTIVTRVELLRGRIDFLLKASTGPELLRAQSLFLETEQLLQGIEVVEFDESAALVFERLRSVKKLKRIGRADLLIASIALSLDATLVTRNIKHFHVVPGLDVVNWVD